MKKIGIGILSLALAQTLQAVDAQFWWQLDQANDPLNPPQQPVLNDPLTIYEDSVLNVTTNGQALGSDFYNGSIVFDHNLSINVDVNLVDQVEQSATIYGFDNAQKSWTGSGSLSVLIKADRGRFAKSIFNFNGANTKFDVGVKTHISATENTQIFSVFRNGRATLNFTNDFVVDLSQATGVFNNVLPNQGITDAKMIFDNAGDINVNPNYSSLVQLTGDIANFGGTITLNLSNADSFFKGRIEAVNTSTTNLNLTGGSYAEVALTLHDRQAGAPNVHFSLTGDSVAKVKSNMLSQANLTFNVNHSSLYADFTYGAQIPTQGRITLNNGGIWLMSQSNTIDYLEINNDISKITKENFEDLKEQSAVDMRFENQGAGLRNVLKYAQDSRFVLSANQIRGGNGVFRITGALNKEGWTRVENGGALEETIATDQIIAGQVFNTHYMQVFWNPTNFDKGLLNQNLEDYKIVVAKQNNIASDSDFVGAVTPIGVYNYVTNLKKEMMQYQGANGQLENGWQWIITDVQRADNSYLSRLLDSLFQSQYRIFKMESDTFNQRMGELRDMTRVHGVWLRTKYGRLSSKSTDQTTASWDEFTSIWLGYDQNYMVLGGKNFLGLALNTTAFRNHGIAEKDDFSGESYYASSRSYGISVYDTYIFDNGLYLDGLIKYYLTDNDFAIRSEVLANNYPKFFTHGLVGSLEVGKKFRLPIRTPDFERSFYYLRPELQFTFGFISGNTWNFKDWSNQEIKARLDYDIPANFRAGLMFGREFNKPFLKGDVYLGTSFEYDINSGGDLRLEDFLDKMTLTHGGNFTWRLNVGTNLILNEYWRIYVDLDTSFFGQISSTFTLNGGVRINFGRLHPKMPYVTPEQDVFDPSMYRKDRRTIPEVQNYETQGILDNYNGRRKRPIYKPPVKIKQRPYGGVPPTDTIQYGITPQVTNKPKGEPVFVDEPKEPIIAPQKNYTRDQNQSISPSVIPQNTRDMQSIKDGLNKGYRR